MSTQDKTEKENEINTLCLKCRNSCKQTAATRIIICPMFEKKRNEFKDDLNSESERGNKDVSANH